MATGGKSFHGKEGTNSGTSFWGFQNLEGSAVRVEVEGGFLPEGSAEFVEIEPHFLKSVSNPSGRLTPT